MIKVFLVVGVVSMSNPSNVQFMYFENDTMVECLDEEKKAKAVELEATDIKIITECFDFNEEDA